MMELDTPEKMESLTKCTKNKLCIKLVFLYNCVQIHGQQYIESRTNFSVGQYKQYTQHTKYTQHTQRAVRYRMIMET
jgi:hypothetical protein